MPEKTALVLLVPEHRRAEARTALDEALTKGQQSAIGVISWDDVLRVLQDAALAPPVQVDLAADVWQLSGLCATYGARDIRPFTADELNAWPARLPDLEVLVDRVSARLSQRRLYPLGREKDATGDSHGHYRRYICGDEGPDGATMSVGVRRPRQGWSTPVCIRYHRDTPGFQDALRRLRSAGMDVVLAQRGHAYVPLEVPAGVGGAAVVDALVQQGLQIHQVALGRVWPQIESGASRSSS